MNSNNNYIKKTNDRSEETTNINTPHFIENSNILNSLLEQNKNPHKILKNIKTGMTNIIKDNRAIHFYKNKSKNLSSFFVKNNNKIALNKEEDEGENNSNQPKKELKKKIYDYLIPPLHEISIDPVTKIKYIYLDKPNLNNINNNRNNNIFIHNNSYSTYYSNINNNDIIDNKTNRDEKKKSSILNKKLQNINDIKNCREKIIICKSFKDINNYKQNGLKNEKNEENVIYNEVKIYKKKNIKVNDYKSNKINEKHKDKIINTNEKNFYENENNKYSSLLNDYRKRMIKKFMSYFRKYYYSFIKKYYKLFILNIKNIKHYSKILPKRYNKKIYKRNVNSNEGTIKDLKSLKINYSNRNFTTLDSEKSNYMNSFNSNKIINEKQVSSPFRTINPFLINNNNIDFSTKENLKKNELFRNNLELEKKYAQIINRKRRKKILTNENNISGDYSSCNNRKENKSIDISHIKNKTYFINKSYERGNKIYYSPYTSELMNSYNILSNRDISKEKSIKIDKKKINKIKTIPRKQKPKEIKIKKSILKIKINNKSNSPKYKRDLSGAHRKEEKQYDFKKRNYIKVNKIFKNISKKQKINNINNSHYNKNIISKTIKNIFTIDKKINIHIKYVFFIPQNVVKKNLKAINKYLQITPNYSYTFFGNGKRSKIYSKKKLTSIKEEEEKSRCSLSIMLNSKTNDEYNSIISYLIKTINSYIIIKMKKSLFYKLKIINLFNCVKNINKRKIFKIIKILINKEDKKDNYDLNQVPKLNDSINDFLVDDKIIINPNIMNNSK